MRFGTWSVERDKDILLSRSTFHVPWAPCVHPHQLTLYSGDAGISLCSPASAGDDGRAERGPHGAAQVAFLHPDIQSPAGLWPVDRQATRSLQRGLEIR